MDDLRIKIRKLSKEQLVYILDTFLQANRLSRADINLIKYSDAPDRIGQIQTGDAGQVHADTQYKHGC